MILRSISLGIKQNWNKYTPSEKKFLIVPALLAITFMGLMTLGTLALIGKKWTALNGLYKIFLGDKSFPLIAILLVAGPGISLFFLTIAVGHSFFYAIHEVHRERLKQVADKTNNEKG